MPAAPLPENAIQPATRAAWRRWLERHHARTGGVWFVYYKQGSGKRRYSYEDVIEEALCFGWIDGVARALDDERAMLWLAPRRPRSVWSAINKQRIARVIDAGLMHAAGLAKIDAAKRDGSWSTYDSVYRLEIPADLASALKRTPGAAANFAAFPKSVKKPLLAWIAQAKRPETRTRRVAEVARRAAAKTPLGAAAKAPARTAKRTSVGRKQGAAR